MTNSDSTKTSPRENNTKTIKFYVSNLDKAGVGILLSPDYELVEIPASMLPDLGAGAIVNMTITRDYDAEKAASNEFRDLQNEILQKYQDMPVSPHIVLKTATQTSITIAWEPLQLAKCDLLGLEVYRNGVKIPYAHIHGNTAKLSGLNIQEEYQIQLAVRTSGGRLLSNILTATTHSLEDMSGVVAAVGDLGTTNESKITHVKQTLEKMGASFSPDLTSATHLISEVPGGPVYVQATELNIPVVNVEWLDKCLAQMRIQPVGPYSVFAKVERTSAQAH
jgi:hypothetical protein